MKTPDARMPQGIVDEIQAASDNLRGANPMPREFQQRLENPTARNIHQLAVWIREEEILRQPLMAGYGQSGNPEQQRLQVLLDLTHNMPAAALLDPRIAGLPPDQQQAALGPLAAFNLQYQQANPQMQRFLGQQKTTPAALALNSTKGLSDTLAASAPLLAAYLQYQKTHAQPGRASGYKLAGTGSMEDFLNNVWEPSQRFGGLLSR